MMAINRRRKELKWSRLIYVYVCDAWKSQEQLLNSFDAIELRFSCLTIILKGSVKTWAFSDEFYSTPSATIIEPHEAIPH